MNRSPIDAFPYQRAVMLLSVSVALTAVAVVGVGWALDVAVVRSVIPGAVGMKAQTALGLAAAAAALLLLGKGRPGRRRALGLTAAVVPSVLGMAVLSEYLFGLRLGIDEFPFVDHSARAVHAAYPGRFAPTTAVCFVLMSIALTTLDAGRGWRWRPAEMCALPIVIVASMSLIGYAYSIPAFYGPGSAAKMAVNTAVCLVALAVAALLARPRGHVLELATTTDPGGVMARRLAPLCVVVPLVLGWLHLRLVGWGVFEARVATWWVAAATIAALVAMVWWCAGTLSRSDHKRRALEAKVQELANRDALTGLFSRHRFEEELDTLIARSRRYGDTGSLLLLDLDRFKPINDSLGHAAGDTVLRAVADAILGRLRGTDIVGRLGGDEFAVLLLHASPEAAHEIADGLCTAIATLEIDGHAGASWTTASIGIAAIEAGGALDASDLLRRADEAMYVAKRSGGNQTALAQAGSSAGIPA